MIKYGVVGRLSIDYIITSGDLVHEGLLGGPAAYAAGGARLWVDSVGIISRVGTDLPESLLKPLQDHAVELGWIRRLPHIQTRRSFTAYESPERRAEGPAAKHYLRLGRNLPKDLLPRSWGSAADSSTIGTDPLPSDLPAPLSALHAILLTRLGWESASLISRALRLDRVKPIILDPPDELMRPERLNDLSVLLRDVDAFIPNLREARSLFRAERLSTWEILEALGDMGPRVVLLKDSLRGLWLYDAGKDRRWTIPVYPSDIIDLTGADSALSGGLMTGLAGDGDPLEAALRGAVSLSLAVEGTGPCYPLAAMSGLAAARLNSLRQSTRRA
jgi:sugar/nucleoside kinase (ribokinase family)